MSRNRIVFSLFGIFILLVWTVRIAAAWFPITATPQREQSEIKAPLREPLKVGGNVQESKLIHKVEPIYPEAAKAARVTGVVILLVTINEDGRVWDINVTRGHPMLVDAAVTAVKQWQYSPTLLNGEPVPVMATVTVIFSLGGALQPEMQQAPAAPGDSNLLLDIHPIRIPSASGARVPGSIVMRSARFKWFEGHPYYSIGGNVSAPELALEKDRLATLAASHWPKTGIDARTPLLYMMYISEKGEVVATQLVQGPKIPEIEKLLSSTQVQSPGHLGSEPVPVWCAILIEIPANL
jgi:TonB family protein